MLTLKYSNSLFYSSILVKKVIEIIQNTDIILTFLEQYKKPILVSELAEKIKINPKNIGRYLKILEDDNLIIYKPSKNDKRKKLIELIPRKMLYFFKFGNKYLLHTRTRLEKIDFKTFYPRIEIFNFPIIEEIISIDTLKLHSSIPKEEIDDYDGFGSTDNITYITPEPIMKNKYQYFYIFDKLWLELLETYLGYTIHTYSLKEVRKLREKKAQTSFYTSIVFNKNTVNLILEKNGKILKTPFIYYDYFILRLNDILTVKNTINTMNKGGKVDDINDLYDNQKMELVKREFKLTVKAFEYYRNIYNFSQSKIINHRIKTKREIKEDIKFEKEREEFRHEYLEEVLKSVNQQNQQHKLREREVYEREFLEINKEYKKPIDKWENYFCCLNDIKKELDKFNYRIAYEYFKINTLNNLPYKPMYEKKDLDKIIMLAVKEAKKSEYIMEQVKQQERLRVPSLEKEVLCL